MGPTAIHIEVHMGLRSILLIAAIICFVLAAIGTSLGSIALVPLGLAFLAGAFLVSDGGFKIGR
jgi:hypothetical protein